MKSKAIFSTAIAGFLAASTAQADLITGVTIESVSSENGGFSRLAINSINGSGLTGDQHSNVATPNMWMANATTATVTYDLGEVYSIESIQIWNYNEVNLTSRGMQDVTVSYGETLALGSTLTEISGLAQASGASTYTGEVFDSFAPFSARYIQISSTSNYGDGSHTGLSEIQFTEVPEPSSLALLGIGGMLIARRRRG